MNIKINSEFFNVLIELKNETGKSVTQLLYEALDDLNNKHKGDQNGSNKTDSKENIK